MLTSFFNDPSRRSFNITIGVFTDLNFGYGVVNGKLNAIIMWLDDNQKLNFAEYNSGLLIKISPEDGDVFIKSQDEANEYIKHIEEADKKKSHTVMHLYNEIDLSNVTVIKAKEEQSDLDKKLKELYNEVKQIIKRKLELTKLISKENLHIKNYKKQLDELK